MPQNTEILLRFIPAMNAWLLGLLFLVMILVAGETGFRLGHRSRLRHDEQIRKRMDSVEAAVLGVLGLLLAFSLVMAVSRFDRRRDLVLEEANAIDASYWTSQVIPQPEGQALAGL